MMTRALLLSLLLHAMLLWLALTHLTLPAAPAAPLQLQLLSAAVAPVADKPAAAAAPRASRPAAANVAPSPGKAQRADTAARTPAPALRPAAAANNGTPAADSVAANVAAHGGASDNAAPATANAAGKPGAAAEKAGETREVRVRSGPKPPYPALSAQLNEQGVVWLLIDVDAAGNPGNVQVRRSSGSERLDRAARNGVKSWRFEPALKDGQPQAAQFEVPIYFRLQ